MAVTHYDLTATFTDLLGDAYSTTSAKVVAWIETNVATAEGIIDEVANLVMLGTSRQVADTSGLVTWTDLVGSDSDAADINLADGTLQYRVSAEYVNAATRRRETWRSGWFSLTADTDLADVVAEQYAPAEWQTAFMEDAQALLDAQIALSGIDDTDSAVAGLVSDGLLGPLTQAALSATFVPAVVMVGTGIDPTGVADSTAAMQAKLDATPVGGICLVPSLGPGQFLKFSTLTIPPGVRLQGMGWHWLRDEIGTFGTAANVNRSNYTGSVLVSTAAAGVAITCATTVVTQAGEIANLLLVGPGSGTATGVKHGALTMSSVGAYWDKVAVINFATGVTTLNVNEGTVNGLTIRGCTTGLNLTANTNNCLWNLVDIQQCTSGLVIDSTCIANLLNAPLFQGNVGVSAQIDGRSNVLLDPYFENSAGTRAIDIVGGSYNKVDSGFLSTAADTLRVQAGAARTMLNNNAPNAGQAINNAGTGTILMGESSTLVDTGLKTIVVDAYNGRVDAGASTGMILAVQSPVAQTNWNNPGPYSLGYFNIRNFSTAAQNASIEFDYDFDGGTYSLDLFHTQDTDGGIYTVSVAGTTVGTIDGYAASTTQAKSTIAVITVSSGRKRVKLLMATKNASSSAYRGYFSGIGFTRTGA